MKIQTNNYEETQKAGEEFAKKITGGDILLLFGNLGDGKTTFMQGVAKGLRIQKRIISPTFIIMRKYIVEKNPGIAELYHIDLYRTQTLHDLEGLGLPEILQDKKAIVAIEWPEKLLSLSPAKRIEIRFTTLDENTREIIIEKYE